MQPIGLSFVPATFLLLITASGLGVAQEVVRAKSEANGVAEFSFHSKNDHDDPFNKVTLDAEFVTPKGGRLRVPAFWDGSNVWKVRYASAIAGVHQFQTICSDKTDPGLHGIRGSVEVRPYTGTNAFYLHGPLKVSSDRRHFEHLDGTPFFWLGDTWWMGLVKRLHWPEDVKTLAEDRKAKGFNVIQLVAGLYPDMFPLEARGENEAGVPWTTNYSTIRPEFFDASDKRLFYLAEQGFSPCIVGAWGYFMQWMGPEKLKQHWRYLIARYGALPVVWCIAGEANLPWYLAKGFPYDDREQVKGWTEVMRYVRETDPFHRLITIHPTGIGRPTARRCTHDQSLLDFDMLQTPHGGSDAVPPTVTATRQSVSDYPIMPVIDGEASFERLNDSIATEWTRRMFWVCMMNGAAGHTYGANGIWQVNRKGHPHGSSPGGPPNGTGYGVISWDEAMNLGGSKQVGFAKHFLEQLPWRAFEPHPEWAVFVAPTNADATLAQAKWIWFDEGKPMENAPAEKRYFRRTFVLPKGKVIAAALRMSADDQYTAMLNGKKIGHSDSRGMSWSTPELFDGLESWLKPGTNLLTVIAENRAAGGPNPAGLIGSLRIKMEGQEPLTIDTDGSWLARREPFGGWETATSRDGWSKAAVLCDYGQGPWGPIDSRADDERQGPQTAGTRDVRVTYIPEHRPVMIQHLQPHTRYAAELFDPATGEHHKMEPMEANGTGAVIVRSPPDDRGEAPDWVLLIRKP